MWCGRGRAIVARAGVPISSRTATCCVPARSKSPPFYGAGSGGRVQEFTWDGQLVWDFTHVTPTQLLSHDVCKLPNGNVLMIVWEKKTARMPCSRTPHGNGGRRLHAGRLIQEVKPTGPTTGEIVWEWHSWDHLIQDFDATKANHGDVAAPPRADRPQLRRGHHLGHGRQAGGLEKLRAIGYVGGAPGRRHQARQTGCTSTRWPTTPSGSNHA